MKKALALILSLLMVFSVVSCSKKDNAQETSEPIVNNSNYKVAMISDYSDITDKSFNQTTYESAKSFCNENKIDFTYYKSVDNSTDERVSMIDKAIADGFNVIVLPGSDFGEAISMVADNYEDVKFIAIDVDENSLKGYKIGNNVYCATYNEEIAGFMAGYAAVSLGYRHLGFLGGKNIPSNVRYGYGFVQGAEWAASIGEGIPVQIDYVYGNQFEGDSDITMYMDTWFNHDVELIFACGGSIYTSAAEAAAKVGGKIIGVDVDQAASIDEEYGQGMTVTSAMKGIGVTVENILNEIVNNENWAAYGGKIEKLGIVSGDDPEQNYVQLPMNSTQWDSNGFNKNVYKDLVKSIADGTIKISDDVNDPPETTYVTVDYQGNIK